MCVCVYVCSFLLLMLMDCDTFTPETMAVLSAFAGSSDPNAPFCLEGFAPSLGGKLAADFWSGWHMTTQNSLLNGFHCLSG